MKQNIWTKQELVAYTLLYVANIDLDETKKEREYIMSRVNLDTYYHIKEEYEADNDFQNITKIVDAVKHVELYDNNLEALFADIKLMAFADGEMTQMEQNCYNNLKKILS